MHLPFITPNCLRFKDFLSLEAVCPNVRGRFRLILSYSLVVPLKILYRLFFCWMIYGMLLKVMNFKKDISVWSILLNYCFSFKFIVSYFPVAASFVMFANTCYCENLKSTLQVFYILRLHNFNMWTFNHFVLLLSGHTSQDVCHTIQSQYFAAKILQNS